MISFEGQFGFQLHPALSTLFEVASSLHLAVESLFCQSLSCFLS